MQNQKLVRLSAGLAIAGLLALPASARAYIDPGTGSYVLQLALAGLLGLLFALRVFWNRTVNFVRGLFRRQRT